MRRLTNQEWNARVIAISLIMILWYMLSKMGLL